MPGATARAAVAGAKDARHAADTSAGATHFRMWTRLTGQTVTDDGSGEPCLEVDLRHPGEGARDRAGFLRLLGGLEEGRLLDPRDLAGHVEVDLGDRRRAVDEAQGDGGLGLDRVGRVAGFGEGGAEGHRVTGRVG